MQKGISIIELMLVLVLLAIVTAIAVPPMQTLMNGQRATATAMQLHRSIQFARQHAVSSGRPTRLEPKDGDWNRGWRVQIGTAEHARVLYEHSASGVHIRGGSTLSPRIEYRPNGRAVLVNGGFQAGTFNVCVPGSMKSYDLIISRVGRLRRATTPDNQHCATKEQQAAKAASPG